jgi:PIN domain nuclease of toxin-antitoxin system
VKALLDTHTFIWWASDDQSLSQTARIVIGDRTNEVFFSAVSTWEMAIKIALGKLRLSMPLDILVLSQISQHQFKPLRVSYDHTFQVQALAQHHRDPFDRLLIAQAMVEGLTILTRDPEFSRYGVAVAW